MKLACWCRICYQPMRAHFGKSGARGPCAACVRAKRLTSPKPIRKGCHVDGQGDFVDDPPHVIEAKFQAALKHARRTSSVEVSWGSSLTRFSTL